MDEYQDNYKAIYLIGIGGIGMSALARYFLVKGYSVGGYDLTPSYLTEKLNEEGAQIHYTDDVDLIPEVFKQPSVLIVYTPAIPQDHRELQYFSSNGYRVLKRSQLLGEITKVERGLCVAGTHGKTTTSTLLAHLLHQTPSGCNAFLGGIANNYKTNLLLSDESPLVVIEADEFDRSFHALNPYMAIITSADPDHLDIYGTADAYRESFEHFTSLIQEYGALVLKAGVALTPRLRSGVRLYHYDTDREADFYADNIIVRDARLFFDWHYPGINNKSGGVLTVELGVPLRINVDNAVAAMAVAYLNGVELDALQRGLASFRGVHRRFDTVLKTDKHILIDDYAHHPVELEASISSVKILYPDKRILGIFQPHLYSRTKDFYLEFAKSLDRLDNVILLDIYPARELPIDGVTSHLIAGEMFNPSVQVMSKEDLLPYMRGLSDIPEVVLMLGAGDIDRLVGDVSEFLSN